MAKNKKPEETIEPTPAPVELQPVAEPQRPAGYVVAPGTSITSRRGILAPGTTVTADLFPGGAETLTSLIDRGLVVIG